MARMNLLGLALDMRRGQIRGIPNLTARLPAPPFRLEGRLLALLVRGDVGRILREEAPVVLQTECFLADIELHAAMQKILAKAQKLLAAHRIEANLIEETQQPRCPLAELPGHVIRVPHLAGAPHELVASGTFHAVDAQIRAADTHRVLRRPRTRGIVFRGDQAVPRIEGRRDRSAQIDVAQPQYQVACAEQNALHLIDGLEAVDPADELDIARTPWGIGAYRLHVFGDRELRGRIVRLPLSWDDARRDRQVADLSQRLF